MAHHKDIERASALLDGTQGWSIKYHPESIVKSNRPKTSKPKSKPKRKDKRRCRYYDKVTKLCFKLKCTCMGSSDCENYCD